MPSARRIALYRFFSRPMMVASMIAAASTFFAACDPGETTGHTASTPTPTETSTQPAKVPEVATAAPVPITPPAGVAAAVIADLAGRLGVAAGSITVASFEAMVWPNGCLGLGGDRVCSQGLVPGWLAILRAPDGTEYRYRGAGTRFEAEP